MRTISKGELSDIDGVILTLSEYEQFMKDKNILEELSRIIKNK